MHEDVQLWDLVGQSALLSETVLERLGSDVRGVRVGGPTFTPDFIGPDTLRDQWGTIWQMSTGGECYSIIDYPLTDGARPAGARRKVLFQTRWWDLIEDRPSVVLSAVDVDIKRWLPRFDEGPAN